MIRASHHPLHQKLGVVRTLFDRKDAIVTEEEDKAEEESTITQSDTAFVARDGSVWILGKDTKNSDKGNIHLLSYLFQRHHQKYLLRTCVF